MQNRKVRKGIKWTLFFIYIAVLVYIMFFAENLGRTDSVRTYRYNLVLFKEIKRFINNYQQLGLVAVMMNLIGNVIAFVPYGFCIPLLSDYRRKFFSVLLGTFALSLSIELIQLIFKVGCFDVDDLLLNTIGGILGYIVYVIYINCNPSYRKYKQKQKKG